MSEQVTARFLALRSPQNGMYFRRAQNGPRTMMAIADIPFGKISESSGIITFADLWAATQFTGSLPVRQQAVDIMELELREVRVVPPVIDAILGDGHEPRQSEATEESHQDNQLHGGDQPTIPEGDGGPNGPVVP